MLITLTSPLVHTVQHYPPNTSRLREKRRKIISSGFGLDDRKSTQYGKKSLQSFVTAGNGCQLIRFMGELNAGHLESYIRLFETIKRPFSLEFEVSSRGLTLTRVMDPQTNNMRSFARVVEEYQLG